MLRHFSSQVRHLRTFSTKQSPDPKISRRFAAIAWHERWWMAGALVLLVGSSAASMTLPASLGLILDRMQTSTSPSKVKENTPLNDDENEAKPFDKMLTPSGIKFLPASWRHLPLDSLLQGLAVIMFLGATANASRVYLTRMSAERIVARLRTQLFSQLVRYDAPFHDKTATGELVSRLATDTDVIGKTLTSNVSHGVRAIVQSGAGICLMATLSPSLAGVVLAVVPPVALIAVRYGRYVKKLSKATQEALSETTQTAEATLNSVRTVQAFVQENRVAESYGKRVTAVLNLANKEAIASSAFYGLIGIAGNTALLGVMWFASNLVSSGQMTLGDLSAFLMYTVYVGSSVAGLSSFYTDWMKGLGASERLFQLLDYQPLTKQTENGVKVDARTARIAFEKVTFSYPSRPEVRIFDELSFVIEPGSVVAITGSTGSGKSSVAFLLLRYYDPTSGRITVNGHDLRDLDLMDWRRQLGVVNQEPTLFRGTLSENIAYGKPEATQSEILTAAVQAHVLSFVQNLPNGLETQVQDRALTLSGGQRQRIAIARACLVDPALLMLDEATSALDSESEFLVHDAIVRLMRGRTVLTIAHRLSTIRRADWIMVLSHGKIVEGGNFDTLMSSPDGTFRRLVERQTQGLVQKEAVIV